MSDGPKSPEIMDEGEVTSSNKRIVKIFMWLLVVAVFVWIFQKVSLEDVYVAAAKVDLVWFFAAVFGFFISTYLFDSMTHYWLFSRFNPPVTFLDVMYSRGETYLLLALGFLYGQGGMAYSISKRLNKPLDEVSGSIVFLMFNTLISLLLFPTLAVIFFFNQISTPEFRASDEWKYIMGWLLISWPLIIAHFLFWIPDWKWEIRKKLSTRVGRTFDKAGIKDYLILLTLRMTQVFLWLFFTWLALKASFINIPAQKLIIMGPMVGLISAIPTPGRLGPSQGAWLVFFGSYAKEADLVAFSLLYIFIMSGLRWLFGALFLLFRNKKQ